MDTSQEAWELWQSFADANPSVVQPEVTTDPQRYQSKILDEIRTKKSVACALSFVQNGGSRPVIIDDDKNNCLENPGIKGILLLKRMISARHEKIYWEEIQPNALNYDEIIAELEEYYE